MVSATLSRLGTLKSLSARRAWIEIRVYVCSWLFGLVALRKESVDRNLYYQDNRNRPAAVALRKESVDRNGMEIDGVSYDVWVALRKESVDRNNI